MDVLKWGMSQNPALPSDLSSYSKDDFNALKNTLQHLTPFIKFYNLTSKEYMDKVYPYKKIIPKDLRENLLRYFMDRQNNNSEQKKIIKEANSKSIDSKIITIKHAELISKWIDRLEISDKMKNLYEFKLILRGSLKDSSEILGGYNPIIRKYGDNKHFDVTKYCFIFSFKNKENIDYILSRVKKEEAAIYYIISIGPSFNGDLILNGYDYYNRSYCKYYAYDKPIRETKDYFSVEEYEIFQIKD
ncbi:hypothetical protein RclHR1_09260007 [Rhizophagus clarus]|uniref:Carbohydrate-binding module family 13 protein n=1 Tax=Rhizophagus clarus TaxID=94130 RepID=A0A2Z6S9W3_9GLOM|nr:hypothetical protein RclHR1_09260007 [Rhizophagus clarus]GET03216.1 carbohydrate-binding module family 13 protein [Rhizophagus clarus]